MTKKPTIKDKSKKKKEELHICGECKNVTPVMDEEKLSVSGEPIIGKCPFWTESNSVLLSWKSNCQHYK